MRKSLMISTLAGAIAILMAMAPAAQAGKHKVNFNGYGTYATAADGSVAVVGSASGEPFNGSYTGTLVAADGTLPAAGTCEAGTATLLLQGERGRSLELVAAGDICGQHVQPPFIVTQVFTGRYDVVSASQKRFLGDEGFFSMRLGNDGTASVFGIDT